MIVYDLYVNKKLMNMVSHSVSHVPAKMIRKREGKKLKETKETHDREKKILKMNLTIPLSEAIS